ncbi:hypothetical protein PPL_03113 [Heterostelium album PN500]|uniref:LysM domain-containing protein n=1 Tax=Heterostelium pallidum (strain ATCC 26659 / Pp 5 / PN500) TaxID=670386 RepID=D3B3Z2_HETP5|nr:hypothetical protein PPL_03113 [Heterostelium album PN500]EFA84040.1 hypothetical protein PPL_03113 [Heterostelium album PN500]|eukprot:XP_020436157.1 hypothetical protein PPL_03113 [Heterostelium album PN500]
MGFEQFNDYSETQQQQQQQQPPLYGFSQMNTQPVMVPVGMVDSLPYNFQQQQMQQQLYPQMQIQMQMSGQPAQPPQFETATDLKRCLKCTKIYYHMDSFNNQACSYHRDNYVKGEERWLCCNRVGREASPCFSTYHVEDENTSQILRSMTIPKPDVVQQNNPIYQNLNFGYVGAERILYEGVLKKQGKRLGFWEKRRFRLTFSSLINYYDETDKTVHRVFQLADITISFKRMSTDDGDRICLVINDGQRNHNLYSPVTDQTEAWIDSLHTQKKIYLQSISNQRFLHSSSPGMASFSPPNPHQFLSHYPPLQMSNHMSSGNLNNIMSNANLMNSQSMQAQQFAPQQLGASKQEPFPIINNYFPQPPAQPQQPITTSDKVQWIQHRVQVSDTLAGLAIKYNTTIDIIKRTNLIKNDTCITHQTLLVPVSGPINMTTQAPIPQTEEEKRRKMIQLFAVSENISKEESRSYLVNNDWDITKALRELKDDLDWEHSHPFLAEGFLQY